jgi:hypothetical protein
VLAVVAADLVESPLAAVLGEPMVVEMVGSGLRVVPVLLMLLMRLRQ